MITLRAVTTEREGKEQLDLGSLIIDGDNIRGDTDEMGWMLRRAQFSDKKTIEERAREAYPYDNGYVRIELIED